MKLLNFRAGGAQSFGALTARGVIDLGARLREAAPGLTDLASFIRASQLEPRIAAQARRILEAGPCDHPIEQIELLSPGGRHVRCFCIGVNYPERHEEYRDGAARPAHPSVFMRTHSSFSAPGEPLVRPRESEQLDYEGEIAVVIGQGGRRIAVAEAMSHVFGYTCANDGSVRDWLRHSKFNVTQGKNFDRSGALGPHLVTADEVGEEPLRVRTRVNGQLRQDDTSDRMLFPIARLISYLSAFCTLEPGDFILTGTPAGAGARLDPPRYLRAGDVVEIEVSRVGVLRNEVVDDVL